MYNVVVLKGGDSPEREVSLISGHEIAQQLVKGGHTVHELDPQDFANTSRLLDQIRNLKTDIVFIGLHGGIGENGEMQAALGLAGIPFTGSLHKACAITMDKYLSKLIATNEGIPVPEYVLMREDLLHDYQDSTDYSNIVQKVGLPMVVKPNDAGSSVGISIVNDISELKPAVIEAFKYSNAILIEQYIEGRELTVTILDGKALSVVEIKPTDGWYDYHNKYTKGKTVYEAPAKLEESDTQLLKVYAERIWKATECSGYARIDFRFNGTKHYFLEVNTLPGMTPLSLTPMAAKAVGMPFGELLSSIIAIAMRK